MTHFKTIFQVDAFTAEPFKGNPAGVCILDTEPAPTWMQNIAMEMNLSETAFVFPEGDRLNIRFYSPSSEIDLCGHATLSASHILYESGRVGKDEKISLHSKAGELTIRKNGEWLTMNFPAYPVNKAEIPSEFESITGARPVEFYRSAYGWTLALLNTEKEVRMLAPDFSRMKNSEFGDLIVTAVSEDPSYDFCLRCFAPALGIDEDPVTGSAHTMLIPYWSGVLGKIELTAKQVSLRGGILHCKNLGERVEIGGKAVTFLAGEITV